jgi:hypothetical protein
MDTLPVSFLCHVFCEVERGIIFKSYKLSQSLELWESYNNIRLNFLEEIQPVLFCLFFRAESPLYPSPMESHEMAMHWVKRRKLELRPEGAA